MTNIVEDIGETGWFQIQHARRSRKRFGQPRDRSITDGAYVAQLLGEDHVRPQLAQERLIDRIDRAVAAQSAAHPFIHFLAG
jgi:hypothetical protein